MKIYNPNLTDSHTKTWGSELWLANNEHYCGKIMYLKKGYRCSIHKHELKDETFYILSGQVWMEWGGHQRVMYTGEAVRIKPGVYHRFEAIEGPAQILEISTTHREDDSYRKTRSEKVTWFRKHVVDRYRAWRGIDTNG